MTNENGMMMNASKSIIIKYKIYISTLSNIGQLMHIKFMRDHFTHVIIDEVSNSYRYFNILSIKAHFTFMSKKTV